MAQGKIKEFDTPANLLRDAHSAFSSMVDETGVQNAEVLRKKVRLLSTFPFLDFLSFCSAVL